MREERQRLMLICLFEGQCPNKYPKKRRMNDETYKACGSFCRCSQKVVAPARSGSYKIPEIVARELRHRLHVDLGFFT